jgi:hypothetical protein
VTQPNICNSTRHPAATRAAQGCALHAVGSLPQGGEPTVSWQQGFRRLRVRDEKRDDIREALVHLANAMICLGRLDGHFC